MNLVFASGFLVPQHPPGVNYFRGLKAPVEARGHKTVFPDVRPLASSEARAGPLAEQINQKYPEGAIHIIAHSMGGLDSRTLIFNNSNGLSERIKSLTTITTPHAGSPIADLLTGGNRGGEGVIAGAIAKLTKLIGDAGLRIDALEDLRTDRKLPDPIERHPNILYRSYACVGRPAGSGLLSFLGFGPKKTCELFVPTHRRIQTVTGDENDGLVPFRSAQYGEFQQEVWQCDHADAVGWNLDDPLRPQFDHVTAYLSIIRDLEGRFPN